MQSEVGHKGVQQQVRVLIQQSACTVPAIGGVVSWESALTWASMRERWISRLSRGLISCDLLHSDLKRPEHVMVAGA